MKKIVTGIVALAMASSMFAANFAARVKMDTNLAEGDNKGVSLLKVKKCDQKDADALVISAATDKAGANFQFWYNYAGDDAALKVRSTNLWFKPVDMVKVTVGDVSVGTYKEMLNWWKDPVGGSYAAWSSWGAKYKSFATVEGCGVSVDVTPVSGLLITAGVTPGADTAAIISKKELKSGENITQEKSTAMAAYGFAVKYDAIAGLPLSAAISWHDDGISTANEHWVTKDGSKKGVAVNNTQGAKWLAIGADYGNMWAAGFYGMMNARLRFEEDKVSDLSKTSVRFAGVTIDNFFKYSVGALNVMARLPMTIRTPNTKDMDEKAKKAAQLADPSYLCWQVKASYALSGFTPYFNIGNDLDNSGAWQFGSDKDAKVNLFADNFNLEINPGVTVNVGSCGIDASVMVNLSTIKDPADEKGEKNKSQVAWSVPVVLSIAF